MTHLRPGGREGNTGARIQGAEGAPCAPDASAQTCSLEGPSENAPFLRNSQRGVRPTRWDGGRDSTGDHLKALLSCDTDSGQRLPGVPNP